MGCEESIILNSSGYPVTVTIYRINESGKKQGKDLKHNTDPLLSN